MNNSSRFFSNRECEYFPCHEIDEPENFNCLFCYCPLYFLEDCGGNPDMSRGYKDCTGCTLPHAPGGYDHVMKRLRVEFKKMRSAKKTAQPD